MKLTNLVMIFFLVFITGCSSSFLSNRKFIDEMEHESDYLFRPGEDFPVMGGDSGSAYRSRKEIFARTPSSSREKQNYRHESGLESELQILESKQTEEFLHHYLAYKDELPTISERVYFLRLTSLLDREEYLRSRGLVSQNYTASGNQISQAVTSGEIILGMGKEDVISSIGRPSRVDVAGNPTQENERWSYYYRGQLKLVFFENGRVEGWEFR